ncbi:mitochondrial import inner membrane translocase subunit Tim54 [Ilyonectria destructans]|nr:mitochondrial import inner membrane translocase subunit Tim54 [Ilyonectria destructans]
MAEPNPPAQPAGTGATYKAPTPPSKPNPVFKMMGLPNLPRKLPSRNWMIFWTITGTITAAIVYDKREKRRATAKWRHIVAPLATEPIGAANQLPRKLTIYLAAPPGDGLRVTQDHFLEYAKPVLAASGLDWEFVQGRQQGDVRAAVAEKIRRSRRGHERPGEDALKTDDNMVEELRKRMGVPEYEGVNGDVVFGLHAWKEYVRGLHEGWLGPLDAPSLPEPETKPALVDVAPADVPPPLDAAPAAEQAEGDKPEEKKEEEKKEEKKTERPPQPLPYNSPDDYSLANLPAQIPVEFNPSNPIVFPHRLGFRHTFVRLGRFFTRRKLADEIGREVAAVCFAASAREWREADGMHEQQLVLAQEEQDWPKSVWKDEPVEAADENAPVPPPKEKIWTSPLVVDARLMERMRRFEISPELEARAAAFVVPEAEVEGWLKGGLRSVWRWGVDSWNSKPYRPNVGDINSDE